MSTLERSMKWMSTGYYAEKQQANEQAVATAPIIRVMEEHRHPALVEQFTVLEGLKHF
jgi:hypothetical protein